MENVLQEKFTRLQHGFIRLEQSLEPCNEIVLNKPPAPGKWSALQIVWHLYRSEFLSVRYLGKQLSSEVSYPLTNLSAAGRMLVLKLVLASPIKLEAPRVVRENMPEMLDKHELLDQYLRTRNDLQGLLDQFPKSRMKEAIYKHPRIGYINIAQTLDFLYWHFIHHEKQILAITDR